MSKNPTAILLSTFVVLLLLCASASAHPATGIVIDRGGRVYFSDLETVWRLDPDGRLSAFRPGKPGEHIHELTIDDEGNVYGAIITYDSATKTWPSALWRRTPEGRETYLFGLNDDPPLALTIWRLRDGSTYFFDQDNNLKARTVLLKRTPDGKVETIAGGAYGSADGRGPEARFQSVAGMAFGDDGSLYVTDGGALRRVFPDGTVRTVVKELGAKLPGDQPVGYGGPSGLALDARGNAYVADSGNRRVLKVTPDGRVERIMRAEPPWSPNGVAAAPDGRLLVLETSFTPPNRHAGPRVRQLSPGGKVTVVASVGEKEKAQALAPRAETRKEAPASEFEGAAVGSASCFDRGVGVYYGLGVLAICAVTGLRFSFRRAS
ncbi:MAG TPA: hypothetical protein VK422_22850 [Pyrinomonadaceae bacterium]|nr:hypothetical protein [Pyrinomonadaceae bacterium]